MNTLTKEWLQNTITSIESARDEIPFGLDEDQNNMLTALKIALASLASLAAVSDERAAYELFMEKRFGESVDRRRAKNGDREYMAWDMALGWIIWCHRAAMLQGSQPVSKREQVRREHAEWSDKTFGDVGPVGPLKHLSKEALEAAAEPDDLSEWADMQFLLWDAQRRAGISDGEITAAMEEKLKVNMARQWPEPKDGEPRQHLKPAPQTVPDSVISAAVNGIMATYADNAEDCREMVRTHVEQACRAAIQESGHG